MSLLNFVTIKFFREPKCFMIMVMSLTAARTWSISTNMANCRKSKVVEQEERGYCP